MPQRDTLKGMRTEFDARVTRVEGALGGVIEPSPRRMRRATHCRFSTSAAWLPEELRMTSTRQLRALDTKRTLGIRCGSQPRVAYPQSFIYSSKSSMFNVIAQELPFAHLSNRIEQGRQRLMHAMPEAAAIINAEFASWKTRR